ncbi:type II toxin-antitoxin system RelE/ParE family toxin [Aeoliella sp. ICT_H6.2]|uniref:Type II toxin-antitoxin system RelE/ParE family toxin n=1 Tax=Aeoliella straminimaris TaxID=2954799 RepID=A0A9X2FFJ7_9BACT|nr:type II toxin-antitoxin system RelE/ParE family toxin [Aeoliella straminimaris]MCO6048105.1 type II toxin-antitoxin system RelE/ParE family toxin [Aeoliella straminimaris]
MKIELLQQAKIDLWEAHDFYELQSAGLGDRFLDSLFADIDSLGDTAGIHETAYGFHRSLARIFPFAIYYLVEDSTVRVYAVLDCRIDPMKTRRRL